MKVWKGTTRKCEQFGSILSTRFKIWIFIVVLIFQISCLANYWRKKSFNKLSYNMLITIVIFIKFLFTYIPKNKILKILFFHNMISSIALILVLRIVLDFIFKIKFFLSVTWWSEVNFVIFQWCKSWLKVEKPVCFSFMIWFWDGW